MTETLSHIALRRLNGPEASDWYTPFPSVGVSLTAEGCLVIQAPEVSQETLVTNDIAQLDGCRFRILGRCDNVVCSGGVKIQIEEVERLLHPHLDHPFLITKTPDTQLGEQVVLLTESNDADAVLAVCRQHLPKYWIPRRVFSVRSLPLTGTGKPARHDAELLATILCRSQVPL